MRTSELNYQKVNRHPFLIQSRDPTVISLILSVVSVYYTSALKHTINIHTFKMCKSLPIFSLLLLATAALTYAAGDSPPVKGTDLVLQATTTTTRPATIFWSTTTKKPPTTFWTTTTKRPPTTFWTTTTTRPPTTFWTTTTKRPPTTFWTTTTKRPPSQPSSSTTHRPTTPAMPQVDCNSGKEFWPHPFCDKYIWCVFGVPQTRQCPSNLYWNTKLSVCDYPWQVPRSPCKAPSISVSGTKNEATTADQAATLITPSSNATSELSESRTMKDSKAYWPYYWQPFYMVKSLPLALPTTSEGAQQTDSRTTSAATQQTDSTTLSTVTSTSSEAVTVKIEVNGTSIVGEIRATTGRPRPSITTTTKRPRRTTTTRKPRPSISATAPIDCSSDIEFWPHPECDKYIWCIDGEQLTQKCSKGLFWNYQLEKCDWPATVPKDHCTNPPPVVNSVVTTTSTTPVPPRDCSTDIEFYSHPDCDKFIRCADGEPQTFICPGNLYWDNDNEQCEWPKKVPTSDCIVPTKKSL